MARRNFNPTLPNWIKQAFSQIQVCFVPPELTTREYTREIAESYTQNVLVYCSSDTRIFARVNALIDTGNQGPNLITDEAMKHVLGIPRGSPMIVHSLNHAEITLGGEVILEFSRDGDGRVFKETFRHVPHIPGGFGMVLNDAFYRQWCVGVMPPPMLMLRSRKETPEERRIREERDHASKLEQEEQARQQAAEVEAYKQAQEEKRCAQGG